MVCSIAPVRAYVERRSQHAKRGRGRFAGPDTYVAVQIVPAGESPLMALRHDIAEKRGIEIRIFGEGYAAHSGPRSMLGRALAEARAYAAEING